MAMVIKNGRLVFEDDNRPQNGMPEEMPAQGAGTPNSGDTSSTVGNNASQGLNDKTAGGLGGYMYGMTHPDAQQNGMSAEMPVQGAGTPNGDASSTADVSTQGTPTSTLSADMSDDEYLKALMPMSKEEEEKRLRGAKTAQGISHLGNILASLGNVIYTGKGSPSQKMADVQDPDYKSLLERNRQQNQQYQTAVNAREKLRQQERKMEAQEIYQSKKLELDAQKQELYKAKLELEMKLAEQKGENDTKLLQAKLDKINEDIRKLQNDEEIARERADAYVQGQISLAQYRQGMLGVARQNANSNEVRAKKYQGGKDNSQSDPSDEEEDNREVLDY